MGISKVWWVEANPAVIDKLRRHISRFPEQEVIEALITDKVGDLVTFNVTNYDGMSSSIFPFGTHPKHSPDTIYTHQVQLISSTIDQLVNDHKIKANLLNLDIQGAELLALQGATKFLESV